MSLFEFGRLIYRNVVPLVIVPLLMAIMVFVFTMNQPKQYASSALIYTGIASGFNIESGASDKVDYHAVNNAFDNLISIVQSKQTVEEVLLRLLATHLVALEHAQSPPPELYNEYLNLNLPAGQRSAFTTYNNVDSTYQQLNRALQNNTPGIVSIIRSDNPFYGTKAMKSLEVKRHKSSDMLKLYFIADHPTTSQLVVELIIKVFTERYKAIKVAETGDVVAYFQKQLDQAQDKLNAAEDKLTTFRTGTRVINYGEQTKAIAIKKQNALEEYSNKKMNLKATEVALKEIEEKLKIREKLLAKNGELLDKRNKLADLIHQLAKTQSGSDNIAYTRIKNEIIQVKQDIESDLETVFTFTNSKEGLPSKQLLNEWLQNVITLNREQVNVDYYKNRLAELDKMYDNFAPLGSTLARLEREISVAEREYLEILNGLNMSKLRQQNIQLSSQLEVVDWPQYPTQPLQSKRKLLIIVGFLFGMISVVTAVTATALLDTSISTPSKAEAASKLKLQGAFPIIGRKQPKLEKKYPGLLQRSRGLTVSNLLSGKDTPRLIVVHSVNSRSGKSTIIRELAGEIERTGVKVHVVAPEGTDTTPFERIQTYIPSSLLNKAATLEDFGCQPKEGLTLVELPALTFGMIPYELLKNAELHVMVARADKTWTAAHTKMVKELKIHTGVKPALILNGAKPYNLDEFLGEIGVKRHRIVKWIRRLSRFELGKMAFNTY